MKLELLKGGIRNCMIFVIGINTGLRISDLLKLKVSDVENKTHILIQEQKTGKTKRFMINSQLNNEIERYSKNMQSHKYLFKSEKSNNKNINI